MATLTIDLGKIEHNARLVAGLLTPHGLRLVGVTKACPGDGRVAAAMLAGGAVALADSRAENITALRRALPAAELQLMRPWLPPAAGEPAATAAADVHFVSTALQAQAVLDGGAPRPLRMLLMVETGDGREGVPVELAADEAGRLAALDGVELAGLATSAACSRPQAPLAAALARFAGAAAGMTAAGCGCGPALSAGGSGWLRMLPGVAPAASGSPLAPLTELRCGEAILLGRIPTAGSPALFLPGAHRDAFILEASVLEVFRKERRPRALVGLGIQDVGLAPLAPLQAGVSPAKITSDYFVVELAEDAAGSIVPGSRLSFIPAYYALLAAMTSPFVRKLHVT